MAKTNSGLLEFKDAQKVLIALDDATSEVKKAVIIDADGTETDIAGVQPTGKKEITSTAEVNVANYATAQVVDEDLVASNIKKDVDILGVVGSYEAQASDFSIAQVTIVNTSGVDAEFGNAVCIHEGNLEATAYFCGGNATVSDPFVLYKGSYNLYFSSQPPENIVCTGGAEFDAQEGAIIITGDCTVTISAA